MITDPSVDAYSKWSKPVRLDCKNDIEFIFIELFEWDRYGFVSYSYYLTKITRYPDRQDLVQQKALLKIGQSKVVCV